MDTFCRCRDKKRSATKTLSRTMNAIAVSLSLPSTYASIATYEIKQGPQALKLASELFKFGAGKEVTTIAQVLRPSVPFHLVRNAVFPTHLLLRLSRFAGGSS